MPTLEVVEPQRIGDSRQHRLRHIACAALLQPGVVVDADPGERQVSPWWA
jgi:hypothetical protein